MTRSLGPSKLFKAKDLALKETSGPLGCDICGKVFPKNHKCHGFFWKGDFVIFECCGSVLDKSKREKSFSLDFFSNSKNGANIEISKSFLEKTAIWGVYV